MKKLIFIAVLGVLMFSSCSEDETLEELELNQELVTEADEPDFGGPKKGG